MFKKKFNLLFLLAVVLIYSLLIAITPQFSYQGDIVEWKYWSEFLLSKGITKSYQFEINYPPVFIYILSIYATLCGNPLSIIENLIYLKYIVLIFDVLPLLVVFYLTNIQLKWWHFLVLLNPAYLHNSILWGQIDAIPSFFVNTAILLFQSFPFFSTVLFTFGICTKIQTVILIPIFGLFWIYKSFPNFLSFVCRCLLVALGTLTLIFLPFIMGGEMWNFFKTIKNQVGIFPSVSLNAFNSWYLFLNDHPFLVNDTEVFWGITLRKWGIIMFAFFSSIALLPTFILVKNRDDIKIGSTALFCFLSGFITILFFYFNTEMHERYTHMAMLAFFYYGILTNRYLPFIISCSLYFINVEVVLPYFGLKEWLLIAKEEGISILFGVFIVFLYYELYSGFYLPHINKMYKFKTP